MSSSAIDRIAGAVAVHDHASRVAGTVRTLTGAVRESGEWLSPDGRVGEATAAWLLGLAPGSLANARTEGRAPPHYRMGGGGHRVTYRVSDLAEWIEGTREV